MFLNVCVWDFGLSCLPILVQLFRPAVTGSEEWVKTTCLEIRLPRLYCYFAYHSQRSQALRFIKWSWWISFFMWTDGCWNACGVLCSQISLYFIKIIFDTSCNLSCGNFIRSWNQTDAVHSEWIPMFGVRSSWRFPQSKLIKNVETAVYIMSGRSPAFELIERDFYVVTSYDSKTVALF